MSKFFKIKLISAATLIALGTFAASPVNASSIVASNQVYSFTGACSDCYGGEGQSTATVTLTGDYTLGTAISSSNFVSFVYAGTNLISGFTILPSDAGFLVSGSMTTIPGANSFHVRNSDIIFVTGTNGNWCVGGSCLSDYGTNGTFAAAASTPEPATSGLIVFGLAAAVARLRKRA